jgi:DNA repair protein RecN (Recombination protein N)
MDLLDQFAGVESTVEGVAVLFKRRSVLEREMESVGQDEQGRLRAIDLLSFQVQEVERARLQPGDDAQLESERRVLANLEKVRAAASSAFALLYEDEDSACSRLAAVNRAAEELARYEAQFGPYLEPLANSRAALEDLAFFVRDYLGRLEANPAGLEELEDRLALIERLKRKYGSTIEEILEFKERSRNQLSGLLHADERRDELAAQLERASAEYRKLAEELSRKRRAAAGRFATMVRQELAQVGMEKTSFEVHFARPGNVSAEAAGATAPQLIESSRGVDQIELRMSPNPGEEPRPLERIASGGELSRLMLALKTVVGTARAGVAGKAVEGQAGTSPRLTPTFIFDEVDAGIGGRVAEQVGQRLKRLSRNSQVLCVTHLPQIACFADHHFYVEKFQRSGRTLTAVKHLENQRDRAQELARMLSGSRITDAVLKHATDMLKQAEM